MTKTKKKSKSTTRVVVKRRRTTSPSFTTKQKKRLKHHRISSRRSSSEIVHVVVSTQGTSCGNFRGNSAAGTWLYRVALNTGLAWRRGATRHAPRRAPSGSLGDHVQPATHESPRSQAAILTDFLNTLGGPDRSVLLLYMEGLSYDEIADVTGLSVNAVGMRLHRMRQTFTERYVER